MRRKNLLFNLVVILGVCLVSGSALAGLASLPCVSGEDEASATATIQAAGFGTVVTRSEFSDTVATGAIVSESPSCGGVLDTSNQVNLVVSLGPIAQAGGLVWNTAFNGILTAFALGVFLGLFIKLTNKS